MRSRPPPPAQAARQGRASRTGRGPTCSPQPSVPTARRYASCQVLHRIIPIDCGGRLTLWHLQRRKMLLVPGHELLLGVRMTLPAEVLEGVRGRDAAELRGLMIRQADRETLQQ